MELMTNKPNGAVNYNRIVEESGRSRSVVGSYMRNYVKIAESLIVLLVLIGGLASTILTLLRVFDGGTIGGGCDYRDNATRDINNGGFRYKHL